MKKRWLAICLICALLTGCGANRTEPMTEEPTAEGETIAYVPLDDRPDNEERVVYLAESLGYTLEMPERDLYRTRLNDQPMNKNGTQYGDRGSLYQWVLDLEEAGCDQYVLSIDQLFSGGLVNSRSMAEHEEIVLPDGTSLTEFEALETLLDTLAADENNVVWLLDSVMRLAPTVGYDHWDLDGYNALRAYGIEARPTLTGDQLTVQNIESHYTLGADGQKLDIAAFGLEENEVEEYLSARARKLELSARMQEILRRPGYEQFCLLIGIDDSSAEECIQKNEIAFLRQNLRQNDALLSGVDDLAFKAVTKLYLEEIGWSGGSAEIRYYGGTENQPACAYDFQPLTQIMEDHLAFFDLESVAGGNIGVLVLTQPADESQKAAYYQALIDDLNSCREAGMPIILIDAGNGQYGTAFHEALTEETELGWLLSYSGFLDMAIVTGTALSHGVARYAYLTHEDSTDITDRAFARTLADSIIKDFCYKHIVRNDILSYVRGDLGGNADNFWQPNIDREAILERAESGMSAAAAAVVENLEHSNFISSIDPYEERGWGGIALENYRFPWDRAFEIGMDIRLGEFTEPHKSVFGMYYR